MCGGEDASRSSSSGLLLALLDFRVSSVLFRRPRRRCEDGAGEVSALGSGVLVPWRDSRWNLEVGGALGSSSDEGRGDDCSLGLFLRTPNLGFSFAELLLWSLGFFLWELELVAVVSESVAVELAVASSAFVSVATPGEERRGGVDFSAADDDEVGLAFDSPYALVAFRRPNFPILVVFAFFG